MLNMDEKPDNVTVIEIKENNQQDTTNDQQDMLIDINIRDRESSGELCRYCLETIDLADETDDVLKPCACTTYVHRKCLDQWLEKSVNRHTGIDRDTCEICKEPYDYIRSTTVKTCSRIMWNRSVRSDAPLLLCILSLIDIYLMYFIGNLDDFEYENIYTSSIFELNYFMFISAIMLIPFGHFRVLRIYFHLAKKYDEDLIWFQNGVFIITGFAFSTILIILYYIFGYIFCILFNYYPNITSNLSILGAMIFYILVCIIWIFYTIFKRCICCYMNNCVFRSNYQVV